jgi:hypothetical protein
MSAIGHNNPPVDFDIDFNRAFRWAVGDDTGLSPTAKLILHTIALVMPSDGSGCFPGLKWISRKSGIPYGTVKRHMKEIRRWQKVSVGVARGRRGNTYLPNIDPEEIQASYEAAIAEYVASQKQSNALAGSPNGPPKSLPDHLDGPPKHSRITSRPVAGSEKAVAGSETPVAGSPGEPLLNTTTTTPSRDHGGSDHGSTVVNLRGGKTDQAFIDRLNKGMAPYGEAGQFMVERMAEWMGKDRFSAAEDIIYKSGLYGTQNVASAFDATQAKNAEQPVAYFNKVLEGLNIEHGFRPLPERMEREMSAAEYRRTRLGREGL